MVEGSTAAEELEAAVMAQAAVAALKVVAVRVEEATAVGVMAVLAHAANAHALRPHATTAVAERPDIGFLPPWVSLMPPASCHDANACGLLALRAQQQRTVRCS